MSKVERPLESNEIESCYENACSEASAGTKVIAQNVQRIESFDDLFYAPVYVNKFQLKGMLDSDWIIR